jgi:hypothetical protein
LEQDLNFANGTIKRWDQNTPSADRLYAVASYFDTTVEYILVGKETSPGSNEPRLSEESVMIAKMLDGLPVEIRQLYLSRLKAVVQAFPNKDDLQGASKPQ